MASQTVARQPKRIFLAEINTLRIMHQLLSQGLTSVTFDDIKVIADQTNDAVIVRLGDLVRKGYASDDLERLSVPAVASGAIIHYTLTEDGLKLLAIYDGYTTKDHRSGRFT